MTDREKLIELLCNAENSYMEAWSEWSEEQKKAVYKDGDGYGFYADHLIANGVTVCERETLHQMYEQGKYEGAYEGQKWIPVTERLPEDEREVLIATEHGGSEIGIYENKKKEWLSWSDEYREYYSLCGWLGEVTHWMPLPSPPRSTTD